MANIHLIDRRYFTDGFDPDGARPIRGVKKNAITYSLGIGTAYLRFHDADRGVLRLNLVGAHAADKPARNIISYSEV